MAQFIGRHVGPNERETAVLLGAVGLDSLEALVEAALPAVIRAKEPLRLPEALSEKQALAELARIASRNQVMTSLIGQGYVNTDLPEVIKRNVLESPAWYTSYTPYQAEISQGRLEALLNFQTMVSDLTGMEVANASLLDEGTAAAEAMAMSARVGHHKATGYFVDEAAHPQTIEVIRTRAEPLGIPLVVGDIETDLEPDEVFGVFIQNPATDGRIRNLESVIAAVHAAGGLVTVATDLLACSIITSPGEMGADIVVGSSQRFGVGMGFGGPHAAFMATHERFVRALPGRLVGVSLDTEGRNAYRLTLQTREQHIRREKATSNICTAQVLLAVIAGFYAVYHGPEGLRNIAERVHGQTASLAQTLRGAGVEVAHEAFFDTLVLNVPSRASAVLEEARAQGLNLRDLGPDHVGLTLDETTTPKVLNQVVAAVLKACELAPVAANTIGQEARSAIPVSLQRTSEYLSHPTFHRYRSETAMLRYLRTLADKDLALDRTMIPLGSCTMKLNATAEMVGITWPEFANIHPFAPAEQTQGYLELITDLENWIAEISGYDAVSLQPNAGSQGEFAGLLAIRAYHQSRGEPERNICLIPSSAHGTNAASAVLAGMKVVVVACDDEGNVDLHDLRTKAEKHSNQLGALMITYPSTHGVYEPTVVEVCQVVHEHGGQVYLDGANLNALVGLARPGDFGADVSHFNLHKTFAIPHGGGGPGVGPIGVKAHLAEFLPGRRVGPVSSAHYGSAGVLPISWMYIRMMGADGLTKATQMAILSANYIAQRLAPHYPVLYTGQGGYVAHECIIDTRPLSTTAGVSVEDIAKRLIDYGFHAPTMSFPVAGTLMIEPTESENLAELDRFCGAMIAIRAEIQAVEDGLMPRDDNPLVHAPHTAQALLVKEWTRAYDRSLGAFPVGVDEATKYWSPVSRIDGAYGDRNLMCACPPIEDYQDV